MNLEPLVSPRWSSLSVLGTSLAVLCGCSGAGEAPDDSNERTVPAFATPGASSSGPGTTTSPASAASPGSGGAAPPSSTPASPPPGSSGGNAEGQSGNIGNVQPGAGQMNGGASNGSGGVGNAGAGNQSSAGSGPPPGDQVPAQPGAEGGEFVSRPVNGGASAAFACPEGATFGNPLDGMGAVTSVGAPAGSFFAFIEGPVWVGSQNRLFFSDNASGPERIWAIDPPFTSPIVFMPNSGSNGLAVDNEDQLLLADQARDSITRVSTTTAQVIETVLPTGNHNPNDLVLRSDENLYFTDPNSGGRGLYRLSPGGQLSGPFTQANAPNAPNAPNGVVLSPDENTLYVGDVQQNFVARFALEADGAIDTQSGEVFVRTRGDTVDGMAVDCAGNLYVGTRTGVEVYAPDATFIGTVPTGESSNATFGGADRRTLFVTSRSVLKFVTLGVPGLPD